MWVGVRGFRAPYQSPNRAQSAQKLGIARAAFAAFAACCAYLATLCDFLSLSGDFIHLAKVFIFGNLGGNPPAENAKLPVRLWSLTF